MDLETTRRGLLAAGVASGLAHAFSSAARALENVCGLELQSLLQPRRAERAVSLRELANAAQAGEPVRMKGLTCLDGYIRDFYNDDIVLWGLSEPNQPDLYFDDLIVAIRAAHGVYYEQRDGTLYPVRPLISIDPKPEVFRRLDGLSASDPQGKYSEICSEPQTVRVEGMPRNSRIAKVLVEADYRMKMVSQGRIKLPISSPFPSAYAAQSQLWHQQVSQGRDSTGTRQTRYWFDHQLFTYQVGDRFAGSNRSRIAQLRIRGRRKDAG